MLHCEYIVPHRARHGGVERTEHACVMSHHTYESFVSHRFRHGGIGRSVRTVQSLLALAKITHGSPHNLTPDIRGAVPFDFRGMHRALFPEIPYKQLFSNDGIDRLSVCLYLLWAPTYTCAHSTCSCLHTCTQMTFDESADLMVYFILQVGPCSRGATL